MSQIIEKHIFFLVHFNIMLFNVSKLKQMTMGLTNGETRSIREHKPQPTQPTLWTTEPDPQLMNNY